MVGSTFTGSASSAFAGSFHSRAGCSASCSLPSTELAHQRTGAGGSAATALKTIPSPSQPVSRIEADECRMRHVIDKSSQAGNRETCLAVTGSTRPPAGRTTFWAGISGRVCCSPRVTMRSVATIEADAIDMTFASLPSFAAACKHRTGLGDACPSADARIRLCRTARTPQVRIGRAGLIISADALNTLTRTAARQNP